MTSPPHYSKFLDSEIDPAFAKRAQLIFEYINTKKPKRILDCGCGRGFYSAVIGHCKLADNVTGIDRNPLHLNRARQISPDWVVFAEGELPHLAFADESFDCIICSEVLEHVKDDFAAVAELHRVLAPGGALLVTVPHENFPFMWDPLNYILRPFGLHLPSSIHWLSGIWADHERLYSEGALRALLHSRFEVDSVKGVIQHSWPFSHFLLYGIGKNIVEAFGVKGMDRFSFDGNKWLSRVISNVMKFPSRLDQNLIGRSVNLFAVARKAAT